MKYRIMLSFGRPDSSAILMLAIGPMTMRFLMRSRFTCIGENRCV